MIYKNKRMQRLNMLIFIYIGVFMLYLSLINENNVLCAYVEKGLIIINNWTFNL